MVQKPSIPKGTRDFLPRQCAERQYIFDTISSVFETFGYSRIETPAMENLSTLLGKYGEEGDKLLFRILNSGDAFSGLELSGCDSKTITSNVCEKGLRYDLTVPFARFVVQHRNDLVFPFKRFQIQPVWRADRPQKGRYREFYQCDADIVGSDSLLNELELVQIVDTVFRRFGIRVLLKINNRKVLAGLAEACGFPDKITDITVAIDKIDKIGLDAVKAELAGRGLTPEAISVIEPVLSLSGDTASKLSVMRGVLASSPVGLRGLDEAEELFGLISAAGVASPVEFDLSLARGLNYYTGAIFEVKAFDFSIGSICGGGRYDNLTGIFGMPGLSGVGISFGADRIYDVLAGLDKFPKTVLSGPKVLVANLGAAETAYLLPVVKDLRDNGMSCEIYPDAAKLKKQFDYASKRNIPYMIITGSDEMERHVVNVKNIVTGDQKEAPLDCVADLLSCMY